MPFITLRRRSPKLLAEVEALPASAWRVVNLGAVARTFRTPRVFEEPVSLEGRVYRQLFIQDLGHNEPTILVTNQSSRTHKQLILRYAQRVLIENALSDAVRFFHMNALSSAVALKVDFDLALLVLASGLYRRFARRMRGYEDAQARQVFRDLLDLPATVKVTPEEVTVTLHRRAHLPIVMASGILEEKVEVPWWRGARLAFRAEGSRIKSPWKSRRVIDVRRRARRRASCFWGAGRDGLHRKSITIVHSSPTRTGRRARRCKRGTGRCRR